MKKPCVYHPDSLIEVDNFDEGGCAECIKEILARRHPDDMTDTEVEAEMRYWENYEIMIPFHKYIHPRLEQLVGRPVWTHEIGRNWEGLIEEAKNRTKPYNGNEAEAFAKAKQSLKPTDITFGEQP